MRVWRVVLVRDRKYGKYQEPCCNRPAGGQMVSRFFGRPSANGTGEAQPILGRNPLEGTTQRSVWVAGGFATRTPKPGANLLRLRAPSPVALRGTRIAARCDSASDVWHPQLPARRWFDTPMMARARISVATPKAILVLARREVPRHSPVNAPARLPKRIEQTSIMGKPT